MNTTFKKEPTITLVVFVVAISTSVFAAPPGGLILTGKVYDGNSKYTLIKDAEIEINISGKHPNVDYPMNNKGEYKVKDFTVRSQHNVKINAIHSEYVQQKPIDFITTNYKKKQNVRMIKKNAFAENNYRKAKRVKLNSDSNVDKAFQIIEEAINLAPRSRYYLYIADLVGNRIKRMNTDGELPINMASFVDNIYFDNDFNGFSKRVKESFFIKVATGFSKSPNLLSRPTGIKTCLQYSIEAYNNAIKISPTSALPIQGKYLLLRKSGNYMDAINTIEDYFLKNNPISSELTIKGLIVDWIGLIKTHTGFVGSEEEIIVHRANSGYVKLWKDLYLRLNQYENYFKNKNIKGNKNIQHVEKMARRIINEQY
jgi:tetratricopeptide (TPR) repeat protein